MIRYQENATPMNDISIPAILDRTNGLPAMIDRAARHLAGAGSAAEILEAREWAGAAYDAAKRAARFGRAKGAHDEIMAAVNRAMADALEIEAGAKRRIADEYDAAQERGEVATAGKPVNVPDGNNKVTTADLGISRKEIHEARIIRDAEVADPGIIHRTVTAAVSTGVEPTRAVLRRAIAKPRPVKPKKRTRHPRRDPNATEESQHSRDLRMLLGVWEAACETARAEFLKTVT